MYDLTRLDNKLRVVTHRMKDRNSVTVGVWTGVGGRYEDAKNKGAAHFLEHIVFKGTKNYGCEDIKQEIEGVGGTLNAFTGEECTCYFAKVPFAHARKTFDILADMVLNPNISAKDVARERSVILEEIKMYHDLPQHLVMDLLDALLWPDHPLGQNIAGTLKSVGDMSAADLRNFHRRFYLPKNIVVAACGVVSHERFSDLVREKLGVLAKEKDTACVKADNAQGQPRLKLFRKPIEQMHLALGVLGLHREHPDRFILSALNVILGANMSSRLFHEVREKRGLAYSISSGVKLLKDTGALVIRGGVHNEKVVEALKVILAVLKGLAEEPVGKNELTRAKDYLLGQLLLGLEDTSDHMFWMGESILMTGRVEPLGEIIRKVKKVTARDVKAMAKTLFERSRWNLSIVGPLTDSQDKEIHELIAG